MREPITWTIEGGTLRPHRGRRRGRAAQEGHRRRGERRRARRVRLRHERQGRRSARPPRRGASGTVHMALGDNHNAYPGGQNVCSLHLDGVFLDATMVIEDDGTLHPEGRRMGAVSEVSVVALADVDPIPLAAAAAGAGCCHGRPRAGHRQLARLLRCSRPGTVLAPVRHETEELAYVVAGRRRAPPRRRGRRVPRRRRPAHPGRRLARRRQHRRRGRRDGLRLPAPGLPAHGTGR